MRSPVPATRAAKTYRSLNDHDDRSAFTLRAITKMRFDILIQFLVPLAIMAMWALTSLLNREAQPLPTRGTAPNPGPGRLNAPTGRVDPITGSRFQPPASSVDRIPAQRWPQTTPPARPGPVRAGTSDDGIMIIGSDNRGNRVPPSNGPQSPSSASAARNPRGGQTRRGSRTRPASIAGPPRPKEADHQRALTSLVNQSLAQKKNRPLEIRPLSSPLSPINAPLTQVSVGTAIEQLGSYQLHTALTSTELRTMLGTSNRLREIALLNELLQPPVSLRSPRYRR
jgi:hypothetical protein